MVHSFPTRRSSDLAPDLIGLPVRVVDPLGQPLLGHFLNGRAAGLPLSGQLRGLEPGLLDGKLGIGAERYDG